MTYPFIINVKEKLDSDKTLIWRADPTTTYFKQSTPIQAQMPPYAQETHFYISTKQPILQHLEDISELKLKQLNRFLYKISQHFTEHNQKFKKFEDEQENHLTFGQITLEHRINHQIPPQRTLTYAAILHLYPNTSLMHIAHKKHINITYTSLPNRSSPSQQTSTKNPSNVISLF